MQYLLNAREMKHIDKNTIEVFGVPSLVLMERAALRVVEMIKKEAADAKRTLVVCGTGNNGGDGMAVARMLYLEGNEVEVWLIGNPEKCSEETKKQYDILKAYGIPVVEQKEGFCEQFCVQEPDSEQAQIQTQMQTQIQAQTAYTLIIDALFGIGLSRNVEGIHREAIEEMNRLEGTKIAIDIPSGIHADSGAVMGNCFYADHTVTFAYNKTGLWLYPGADAAGQIHIVDIGITKESFLEKEPQMLMPQAEDLTRLPKRKADSNKGTYGKVLVIAGSEEISGAAYFSAKAAYLSGCGLVKVFTHEKNRTMLTTRLPEAIPVTYDGKKNLKESLIAAVQWADVLVLGPGLGRSDTARQIVKLTIQTAAVPIIVDAKTQYVSACNTVETILIHEDAREQLLPMLKAALDAKQVELRGTKEIAAVVDCVPATEMDDRTEYLDYILSAKTVKSVEEAIVHINRFGSHHTDCIITENPQTAEHFMNLVDSAGVYQNCSTRFEDGYRYGFGAEVGISTGKLHARGPVGLEGLVSYKYKLYGSGQIVADYASGEKQFHFKNL